MINLRLAVPAILAAAALAACFTYFVTPPAPVEADQRSMPTVPNLTDRPDTGASIDIDQRPSAEGKSAAAYRQAAEAILKRASNARADVRAEEPPITERIPLPKRRPDHAPMTAGADRTPSWLRLDRPADHL